jgi:hypothetical protein
VLCRCRCFGYARPLAKGGLQVRIQPDAHRRRDVLASAAAVVAATTVPAVPAIAVPQSYLDWLDPMELDAINST